MLSQILNIYFRINNYLVTQNTELKSNSKNKEKIVNMFLNSDVIVQDGKQAEIKLERQNRQKKTMKK